MSPGLNGLNGFDVKLNIHLLIQHELLKDKCSNVHAQIKLMIFGSNRSPKVSNQTARIGSVCVS